MARAAPAFPSGIQKLRMTLDKATAAKLRAINLAPIEEFAKARAQQHLNGLAQDMPEADTAKLRGQYTEARFWSRLSEAVEHGLKQP